VAKVRAAILAAGRGVRMGGERPKTLLDLEGQGPMLQHILGGLRDAGVEDLMVVTGFKPAEIQGFVSEHWGEATYVLNARYASWGNFHSVRVAVDQSPGFDLMIVNSDIVVSPSVFKRVIAKEGDLVLAVQRKQRLDQEDMRVQLDGDKVVALGKELKMARSHGEYCGVSMLRHRAQRLYGDVATRWEWQANTHGYYEDAAGEYAEVDKPEDVPAAVKVIGRHLSPATADASA
jgi:choline kinase